MTSDDEGPPLRPPGLAEAAREAPGGWVYDIAGGYGPDDEVPPEAIRGAWKVDDHGQVEGDFVANPNFDESVRKGQPRS